MATGTQVRLAAPSTRTTTYAVVSALCRPLVRLLFRPRLSGLEHLPESGGYVLCCNQLSNLDGFGLAYALHPRQPFWMGKTELFNRFSRSLLRAVGIFPVRRGTGDLEAIATAVELARSGSAVGIFPEGTRRRKGTRKHREPAPHTGAARVALAAGVPLVPAAIAGTEGLIRLRRWDVRFGPPVALGDLQGNARLKAREATRRLWDGILELETRVAAEKTTRRRLHPRLRLDLSLGQTLFALTACAWASRRGREERVLRTVRGEEDGLVCLSVRSGLELLLEATSWEPGDAVAVSAVTHPDMVRILEARGLRVDPVDLDAATLGPRADLLEDAIGARTRAVLVAHLFGGRTDLTETGSIAREHGLLLIEDCAQSFRGPQHRGDELADVSLFSFGLIKTTTGLGGAVIRVRNGELRARMRDLQTAWPLQPRREYGARALKSAGLVLLQRPRVYALFARALGALGRDLDLTVGGAVRGFPGPELVRRIRRRPCAPLLAFLERRLRRFDAARLVERARRGELVAGELGVDHPGRRALDRTHWVFPVAVPDPAALVAALRNAGFDAATATSSIAAVGGSGAPRIAQELMSRIVFLPVYPELPAGELDRLVEAVERELASR